LNHVVHGGETMAEGLARLAWRARGALLGIITNARQTWRAVYALLRHHPALWKAVSPGHARLTGSARAVGAPIGRAGTEA